MLSYPAVHGQYAAREQYLASLGPNAREVFAGLSSEYQQIDQLRQTVSVVIGQREAAELAVHLRGLGLGAGAGATAGGLLVASSAIPVALSEAPEARVLQPDAREKVRITGRSRRKRSTRRARSVMQAVPAVVCSAWRLSRPSMSWPTIQRTIGAIRPFKSSSARFKPPTTEGWDPRTARRSPRAKRPTFL